MAKTIDKEKEIKEIMRDAECTREEAEEIFAIEERVRENGSHKVYAESEKPRTATKRVRKPDESKREIISALAEIMAQAVQAEGVEIANPEREITFSMGADSYSLVLTKHRPKKGA